MAIGNGELVHKYFPKHSRMGTARMKEDGKKRGVSVEKVNRAQKKEVSTAYHYLIKIEY